MALPEARTFQPGVQSIRGEEPLLVGLIGPPGGGKTVSALRLATGMRAVRPGPVVLIDTEGGRSKKYSPPAGQKADPARLSFDFLRVDLTPPFRSHDFLAAIKAQLPLKPAAIIVDVLSDEHEGEGGFLEWHDAIANAKKGEPGYVGGNEWAAWGPPKAARKRLLTGLLQIKTPLLFTFRAREKTQEATKDGKKSIINIGWMPVAPLEIVHSLDLTCILPPKADGVPVWSSDKIGEDFIVKLPAFLAPLVKAGQLSEATGEALARWALGDSAPPANIQDPKPATGDTAARLKEIGDLLDRHIGKRPEDKDHRELALESAFGTRDRKAVAKLPADQLEVGTRALRESLEGLERMKAEPPEREPGSDDEGQPALDL